MENEIDLPLKPCDLAPAFFALPSDIIEHFTLDGFTAIISEAVADSILDTNDADSNNQFNASR